jgi:hypothetical protein
MLLAGLPLAFPLFSFSGKQGAIVREEGRVFQATDLAPTTPAMPGLIVQVNHHQPSFPKGTGDTHC